ncbi:MULTISPECIES: nuclear transport factor 2 family protein [unclassified Streptomyces]|uniref:nuclear transport factor 2 family protein n=1 Tax=unclassified Streptomyces TaxID=2593676 RepID=UPI0022582933|nr:MULTISPECIES: nuclear transport factor 2 family protein [unclassified Streptomyces]MCX4881650.1 nuclear transport factor 2 family protein [Streptomyces sp. NBC_00847]MCX5421662.1 nuclear transport factor 2 family protein [Streptomyces sp. NBC_00078]
MPPTTSARRTLVACAVSAVLLGAAAVPAVASAPVAGSGTHAGFGAHAGSGYDASARLDYQKAVAADVLVDQLLVKKDPSALDRYWGSEYHQHNPNIADGVEGARSGLGAYFKQFPQLTVTPKRVIAEGDLVAVHSHYLNAPGERGQAVVDLFRVRGGKIVEHWNVLQDVPESSANGNGMF